MKYVAKIIIIVVHKRTLCLSVTQCIGAKWKLIFLFSYNIVHKSDRFAGNWVSSEEEIEIVCDNIFFNNKTRVFMHAYKCIATKVVDILRWSHSIYDNDEMYVSDVSSWGAELINQHAFKLLSLYLAPSSQACLTNHRKSDLLCRHWDAVELARFTN